VTDTRADHRGTTGYWLDSVVVPSNEEGHADVTGSKNCPFSSGGSRACPTTSRPREVSPAARVTPTSNSHPPATSVEDHHPRPIPEASCNRDRRRMSPFAVCPSGSEPQTSISPEPGHRPSRNRLRGEPSGGGDGMAGLPYRPSLWTCARVIVSGRAAEFL